MSARIIRLSPAVLTDLDGVPLDVLAEAHMRRENCDVETAVDLALQDVLIDLSRRVYAARQGVWHMPFDGNPAPSPKEPR